MMRPNPGIDERRRETRFPLAMPVTCTDPVSHSTLRAQVHDISDSGLGLLSTKCLPIGTLLEINVTMFDNNEHVSARGRVMWVEILTYNKYRLGVKLEEQKLKAIELVLRTASSQID